MIHAATGSGLLQNVLKTDLRQPVWLSRAEVDGGWRERFPELARLPAPYPIFARDEESVLTHGYPLLVTPALEQLRRELAKHLEAEVEYRLDAIAARSDDKSKVMQHRERYLRALTPILENALLNDYGRGLVEILLLSHSADLARLLPGVTARLRSYDPALARERGEAMRWEIVGVFADLLQRATHAALTELRRLAGPTPADATPLLAAVCRDQLLLAELIVPTGLEGLAEYMRSRLRQDATAVAAVRDTAFARLREVFGRMPSFVEVVQMAVGSNVDLDRPQVLLDSRVVEALRRAGLWERIGLSAQQAQLLGEIGQRLKRFELLATLRRRILPIAADEGGLSLVTRSARVPISSSLRPFDFTRPGVVDTAVLRFGMVYDLSNFTAVLEEVRKKGPAAEEKALRFMYAFLNRLEQVRRRRRLTFEKFLGDGAFYSSRRALRMIAAACEVQQVYDELRRSGFPFDQGIRFAMNYGSYQLLPLLADDNSSRFEFFGHSVVELARLTTGKSVREVDEIAEFLVHSGFEPGQVDGFLAPLLTARGGREQHAGQPYPAWIDARGELINEGMVASIAFVEQLYGELAEAQPAAVSQWGHSWVAFPCEPSPRGGPWFGLRYLGVARLKGLPPQELVAAASWPDRPPATQPLRRTPTLLELLRRLDARGAEEPAEATPSAVPPDLAVVSFLDDHGMRSWIFGEYRSLDDMLLHALQVPLSPPDLERGEPIEMWLFRHREELAGLYDALRRDTSGRSVPLPGVRQRTGYLGCFLSAPHRSPG